MFERFERDHILITGAGGFVGGALLRQLVSEHEPVVAMVREWPKGAHLLNSVPVVRGSVTSYDTLRAAIADYEIKVIYHLAAQSIVSTCAEDPVTALETAVMGTARLLQAVRDARRPIKVIVSTSDKVYGSALSPYTENSRLDARHAYEVSKACQDLVARMFYHNYDRDVRVVRAVNIYGPGDPNESRLIPRTIQRLLQGQPPVLHAGASDMRRQYVYIDDMLSALRTVADKGKAGEAYCVGSPSAAHSVREVMQVVAEKMGASTILPDVKAREDRFREIQEQSVDDAKLRGLGWTPRVDFPEGIRKTIAWYGAQMSGARSV